MTDNSNLKSGDILEKCEGYSMLYYRFFLVLGINEKSMRLQELNSKVHESTTDPYRPYVVPDLDSPKDKPFRRKSTTFMGRLWDGKPCLEDHLD